METKKIRSKYEVPKTRERRKRNEKQLGCSSFSRRPVQHIAKKTITSRNISSSSSSSSSSSASIEAPSGCLRFFLPHSSSSTTTTAPATVTAKSSFNRNCFTTTASHFGSKIPKSTSISRLPHSKPFPFFKHNASSKPVPPKVNNSQSSKKPNLETPTSLDSNNLPPVIQSVSVSQDPLDLPEKELHFTPVTLIKIATSSPLDCAAAVTPNLKNKIVDDDKSNCSSSNTKTPPLQASFSPEIHSNTPLTAATPACYGAVGHLISGVTDRRKCRARGVLAIPESADNELSRHNSSSHRVDRDEHYASGHVNESCVSILSSPAEASMHWLLSPCHEDEEDDKENSAPSNILFQHTKTVPSPTSPLSDLGFSFDRCNLSNNTNGATNNSSKQSQRNTNDMFVATQLPQFQLRLDSLCEHAFLSSSPLKEEAKHSCNIDGGNSTFSVDTFGSGNVMQTPNSDSSLECHVGLSCSSAKDYKRHHFQSGLLSAAADLRMSSLSPKSHVSIWDITSSSFQFDGQMTTPSSSFDLPPFQKILTDQSLWTSNSTFENVSPSQMRISWREGLVSRIFEMDELDSCRCLSDEEEDLKVYSNVTLELCRSLKISIDGSNVASLTNTCGSSEFQDGESKEKLHSPLQCSYAESISTDGGGLSCSEDSGWNLCYKNNLFEPSPLHPLESAKFLAEGGFLYRDLSRQGPLL